MSRILFAVILVSALVLCAPLAPPALAAPCGASTGETISGNLTVPANTSVAVNGVIVTGNVVMLPGSSLVLCGDDTINGSISGTNINALFVFGPNTRIQGAITINGAVQLRIQEVSVGGAVSVQGVGNYAVTDNTIGGNTTISANTAPVSRLIQNNHIGGKLNCSNNNPAPTGSGNAANGGKKGHCAGL